MGNSTSSSGRTHHDDTVDYGSLTPQGVYTGPRDWNQPTVSQLIIARKLAPFYRPLEEYDESWDEEQILAARKELPESENGESVTRTEVAPANASKAAYNKRPGLQKEPSKPEAAIYRGAVECPICFLYYPPNINHSRCCDQAICTECFVQIKRAEPTTTHLVSEPAACPYCVQDNFGVVYTPPAWRGGLGSEGMSSLWSDSSRGSHTSIETSPPPPAHKRRQKSFSADSPEVVTTDLIRPDWEAKLAAVRAAVTRRANRRIIMRQVGDRLIPVGVTSGRVHALSPEEAAGLEGADGAGSRRSRRRQPAPQGQGFEQFMGMSGQDIEEMMYMEAVRLSLIEREEYQRKEEEEKKKNTAAVAPSTDTNGTSESQAASGPGPSTLEARSSTQPSSAPNLPSSSSSLSPASSSPSSSGESLTHKRKSWSLSRSRTPPPPAHATSNASLADDTSSVWRGRTANPSPFSTLNAALTSTSTAAAFLGSGERNSTASTPTTNGDNTLRGPVPSITVGDGNAKILIGGAASSPLSDSDVQSTSSSTVVPETTAANLSTYAVLPSTSSDIVHEPLLGAVGGSGAPENTAKASLPELSLDEHLGSSDR